MPMTAEAQVTALGTDKNGSTIAGKVCWFVQEQAANEFFPLDLNPFPAEACDQAIFCTLFKRITVNYEIKIIPFRLKNAIGSA
jgi:hypothetical protein